MSQSPFYWYCVLVYEVLLEACVTGNRYNMALLPSVYFFTLSEECSWNWTSISWLFLNKGMNGACVTVTVCLEQIRWPWRRGAARRDVITLAGLVTSFWGKNTSCAETENASLLGRGVQVHQSCTVGGFTVRISPFNKTQPWEKTVRFLLMWVP